MSAPQLPAAEGLPVEATKELIDSFCRLALVVSVADVQYLVAEFDRMDTWMPLTDPTAYRALLKTMPGHRRVAEAFLAFRQVLQEEISRG